MNVIKEIIKFQQDRELDKQPYDALNELTSIVEELMEALGYDIPKENRKQLKTSVTRFIHELDSYNIMTRDVNATREDAVDAFGDIIVFAIGAILKLGYDPEKSLEEISKEINSRKGEMSQGKFEKFKGEKYTSLWYKADLALCKLK